MSNEYLNGDYFKIIENFLGWNILDGGNMLIATISDKERNEDDIKEIINKLPIGTTGYYRVRSSKKHAIVVNNKDISNLKDILSITKK